MWNPSVDINVLKKRNIVFCGTEKNESTAELSWLLTQVVEKYFLEFVNMKNGDWQTSIEGHCTKDLGILA